MMGVMSIQRHLGFWHLGVTPAQRSGFSLLELLAVIAIMALLSTLAVTSYFSAIRGMATRSAKRHFENALVQARQRACLEGVRVSLMAFNETVAYDTAGQKISDFAASYVVCKEIGRLSFVPDNQAYLVDEFADLDILFPVPIDPATGKPMVVSGKNDAFFISAGLIRLYNLNKGCWWQVRPYAEEKTLGDDRLLYQNTTHPFKAYALVVQGSKSDNPAPWEVGDAYGVEVAPVQSLPKKYTFEGLDKDNTKRVLCVTFEPDGSRSSEENQTKAFTIKGIAGETFTYSISDKGLITIPKTGSP